MRSAFLRCLFFRLGPRVVRLRPQFFASSFCFLVVNEKELYYGDCLEGDMVEDPIMKYTSGTCSYYCKNRKHCLSRAVLLVQ